MAKKRSRNPLLKAFGQWLDGLRAGRSRGQIERRLGNMGTPLGGSTLAQYEKGTVWAPDPTVLHSLSMIYGQPVSLMIDLLALNRNHPELESAEALMQRFQDFKSAESTNYARQNSDTDVKVDTGITNLTGPAVATSLGKRTLGDVVDAGDPLSALRYVEDLAARLATVESKLTSLDDTLARQFKFTTTSLGTILARVQEIKPRKQAPKASRSTARERPSD